MLRFKTTAGFGYEQCRAVSNKQINKGKIQTLFLNWPEMVLYLGGNGKFLEGRPVIFFQSTVIKETSIQARALPALYAAPDF